MPAHELLRIVDAATPAGDATAAAARPAAGDAAVVEAASAVKMNQTRRRRRPGAQVHALFVSLRPWETPRQPPCGPWLAMPLRRLVRRSRTQAKKKLTSDRGLGTGLPYGRSVIAPGEEEADALLV